jgi:hypothetical protein
MQSFQAMKDNLAVAPLCLLTNTSSAKVSYEARDGRYLAEFDYDQIEIPCFELCSTEVASAGAQQLSAPRRP